MGESPHLGTWKGEGDSKGIPLTKPYTATVRSHFALCRILPDVSGPQLYSTQQGTQRGTYSEWAMCSPHHLTTCTGQKHRKMGKEQGISVDYTNKESHARTRMHAITAIW